jgi:homoserine dehydrogenase
MQIKIGLFGFGCVAQGFYRGLQQNPHLNAVIHKICVKNSGKLRNAPAHLFTMQAADIFENKEIDVIIELIDDADAALKIIHHGLSSGIPVISANKKALAQNLRQIIYWQEKYETPLLYEGAVAGSIPILQNLKQFFGNQEIRKVRGILNGTTNYILTSIREDGIDYNEALKRAQDLGFAESNPTLDVSGLDAVYKTILLAWHAFQVVITRHEVDYEGIDNLSEVELDLISKSEQKLKYIATLEKKKKEVTIRLKREWVHKKDPLYGVDYELNAITVEGNLSGEQTYIGRGAGSLPTGSAVLYDLKLLVNQFNGRFAKVGLKRIA